MTDNAQNSCGTCVACCYALPFSAEDGYRKKAGDMCVNCTGSDCRIYEARYQLCRLFLCGWRQLPLLGEDWRPDKSGVMLMEVIGDEIPQAYRASGAGMDFLILTDKTAIQRPGFAEYVATLVARKVAVYLSLIGSPKAVINPFLESHVAANDLPGLTKMLLHIYGLQLEARRQGITAEGVKAGH